MDTSLILFSGLAGTGKTTLAHAISRELRIPVISFDYFIDYALPRHVMTDPGNWTNHDVFEMMNKLAEQQLLLGVSVIMDAVYFSRESRNPIQRIAKKLNVRFCVIHTFCSDKDVWWERVLKRARDSAPHETPAQWDTVMAELEEFEPWNQGSALFVDSIYSVEINLQKIRNY